MRFALAGVIALAVVGVISFVVMRHVGTTEALQNARDLTRVVGRGIAEPNLTEGLLKGDPAAISRFDRIMRRDVVGDPIVRVKVWTPSGRVVYSDARRLIGRRFKLGADEVASLRTGEVDSGVTNLSLPENRYESGLGKLLEVYLPVRTSAGSPLLFEAYERFSSVASSGRQIWLAFAPALIIALVVLELVQLPLASSMARRMRRGSEEREALLKRAVDASEDERRRIAGDLHDGIVQDLAGVSFSLSADAQRLDSEGSPDAADALRQGAAQTRQSVRELRSLLVELHPPRLRDAGLAAALSDLVAPLAGRGLHTGVDVPEDLELPTETEALLFRVAQEATRNAASHADATRVDLLVSVTAEHVRLTVQDDGRGFSIDDAALAAGRGHLGLRLLRDLADDAGAALEIDSEPGRGTKISIEADRR
jgi:two-component system, NarL family, sensor kinase